MTKKRFQLEYWGTVLIVIAVLALLFSACRNKSAPETVSDPPTSTENAIIAPQCEGKGNYSFFDATDSYVFFSYSEKAAQVDAYNYLGEYQFSVLLSARENGSVEIRCQDNLLYICSKYGNVFVFSGEQLIESYSEEDANSKGYTSSWFQKRSIPIKMGLSKIHRQRDNGTDSICIPSVIIARSAFRYAIIGMLLLYFLIQVAVILEKKNRLRKS